MAAEPVTRKLIEELGRTLDRLRTELDRVEVLATALQALSQPIPDYEPKLKYFAGLHLSRHELSRPG